MSRTEQYKWWRHKRQMRDRISKARKYELMPMVGTIPMDAYNKILRMFTMKPPIGKWVNRIPQCYDSWW